MTLAEAKAQLSCHLDAVEAGQAVVITRRGKAVAELVPRLHRRDLLPQREVLRASLPEQPTTGMEINGNGVSRAGQCTAEELMDLVEDLELGRMADVSLADGQEPARCQP